MENQNNQHEKDKKEQERANFWIDVGPASGYIGTIAEETARKNGDISPDGHRFHWEGGEDGGEDARIAEEHRSILESLATLPTLPIDGAFPSESTQWADYKAKHPERQNTEETE